MNENAVYLEQIQGMSKMLSDVMAEVDDAALCRRPGDGLNQVGFIYWHILRIWDWDLSVVIHGQPSAEDAWHRGGFSEASGYEPIGKGPSGSGMGYGYTDADVDEVPYAGEWLARYHAQLLQETDAYLAGADEAELHREIVTRPFPNPVTPAARAQHIVAHSWNHIGEIRLSKGLLGYPEPTTPPRG